MSATSPRPPSTSTSTADTNGGVKRKRSRGSPHAYLHLIASKHSGCDIPVKFPLTKPTVVVGREKSKVDFYLDSLSLKDFISRKHAVISFRPSDEDPAATPPLTDEGIDIDLSKGVWEIIDNKSTNGLYVNHVRVARALLHDGDIITFGGKRSWKMGQRYEQPKSQFVYEFHEAEDADEVDALSNGEPPAKRAKVVDEEELDRRAKEVAAKLLEEEKEKAAREAEEELERIAAEAKKKEMEAAERLRQLEAELAEKTAQAEQALEQTKAKEEENQKLREEKDAVAKALDEAGRTKQEAEEAANRIRKENSLIKKQVDKYNQLKEEYRCAICYSIIVQCHTLTPCSHHFCYDCICSWRAQPTGESCPTCREPITSSHDDFIADNTIAALIETDADDDDRTDYRERLEKKKAEEDAVKELQRQVELAKKKGKSFLSIRSVWSAKDKKTFSHGIRKYLGKARQEYCKLTGLTNELIDTSPRGQLDRYADNVQLTLPLTVSTPEIKRALKLFLIVDPGAAGPA